jgi:GTPase SAR1 family protein
VVTIPRLRFTEGAFDPELACTIGVDFKLHLVDVNDRTKVKLSIWDTGMFNKDGRPELIVTAGQEKFQSLTPSYYRDAHVVFLGEHHAAVMHANFSVYDVSSRKSFESVAKWLHECDLYATYEDVIKFMVGNKVSWWKRNLLTRAD